MSQRPKQPLMILSCQHDSHPFQERTIVVNENIKVGRAVARLRPSATNAIFDCKVLSRSHAIISYNDGEFWLRDTNSSNGTFVNNVRLVKKDDSDVCEREVFSGDILRFGVDVVENDTTHGCIMTMVTLYLPNGLEAKPRAEPRPTDTISAGYVTMSAEEIFQISCYINDTIYREQVVEKKLESLKASLLQTQEAAQAGWQAMLNEDKLLEKLSLYESELRFLKENISEDSTQQRLLQAIEEKSTLERKSKVTLESLLREQADALLSNTHLERCLGDMQQECVQLRESYVAAQESYQNLSKEFEEKLSELTTQLNLTSHERGELKDQLTQYVDENTLLKNRLDSLYTELTAAQQAAEKGFVGKETAITNGPAVEGEPVNNLCDANQAKQLNDGELKNDLACRIAASTSKSSPSMDGVQADGSLSDISRKLRVSLHALRDLQSKLSDISKRKLDQSQPSTTDVGEIPDNWTKAVSDTSSMSEKLIALAQYHVSLSLNNQESAMTGLKTYLLEVNHVAASSFDVDSYVPDFKLTADVNGSSDRVANLLIDPVVETDQKSLVPLNNKPDNQVDDVAMAVSLGPTSMDVFRKSQAPTIPNSVHSPESPDFIRLQETLRLASLEIDEYKRLVYQLRHQGSYDETSQLDSDSTDELSVTAVREECERLRTRISEIEHNLSQTRADHTRLVEESRRQRADAEVLRCDRNRLQIELKAATDRIVEMESHPTSSSVANGISATDVTSLSASAPLATEWPASIASIRPSPEVLPDGEGFELAPRHLANLSTMTVIPLMVLLCAIMFAIFTKLAQ